MIELLEQILEVRAEDIFKPMPKEKYAEADRLWIDRAIKNRDVEQIAGLIGQGKVKETPEILKLASESGWTVAHWLAYNSGKTGWKTDDKEILKLVSKAGWTVAHVLASRSGKTGWKTDDKEILKLVNEKGRTVEAILRDTGVIK